MDIESLFLQLKEFDIKNNRNMVENLIEKFVKYFIINIFIDKRISSIHFTRSRKIKFRPRKIKILYFNINNYIQKRRFTKRSKKKISSIIRNFHKEKL